MRNVLIAVIVVGCASAPQRAPSQPVASEEPEPLSNATTNPSATRSDETDTTEDRKCDTTKGGFGFGRAGYGPGGCSHGWGTIRNPPDGQHSTVTLGQPTLSKQSIPPAVIRQSIDEGRLFELTNCYNKELHHTRGLSGTVNATFTIGGDGAVTASAASGIGNSNVEACVTRVIESVGFPDPADRKPLDVTLPVTFQVK